MADLPKSVPTGIFGMSGAWPYISMGAIQTLGGAFSQAEAASAQGAFAAAQDRTNAKLAEMSATDALSAGDWQANQILKKGRAVAGSQLASSGGQGVTVGSMAPEVARTNAAAATDALMARFNGLNKAFGFKMQKIQDETKAEMPDVTYANTLATGGLRAIEGGLRTYLDFDRGGMRGGGLSATRH